MTDQREDNDRKVLHAWATPRSFAQDVGFSNFAISFTIISILSGTLTLYCAGINYGGPSKRRGAGRSSRCS